MDLRIWCEAPEYDDRESATDHRFMVQAYAWDVSANDLVKAAGLEHLVVDGVSPDPTDHVCWGTDDPHVAIRIFILALAHLQAALAAERRAA